MSLFAEAATECQSAHDEFLGDDYEYRATSDDDWIPITARKKNERIENKKTAHGWSRVTICDFTVQEFFIDQPILHAQLRVPNADRIYTVTEFVLLTSGSWKLTCQHRAPGEISRPKLRRI